MRSREQKTDEDATALTRTRVRIARTVVKIRFAGEPSTASLSKISILSLRETVVLCLRAAIIIGLCEE